MTRPALSILAAIALGTLAAVVLLVAAAVWVAKRDRKRIEEPDNVVDLSARRGHR